MIILSTIFYDDPLKKKLIEKNKNVNFQENLKREDIHKELYESDLFISMSLTKGMPMAVLEAMASGLPVILSDIRARS
jgi:glycosyltransferase involved in cell wall biosynthesis|tara:strand:- start:763 stop:996 length:234 start_codon:yes stop_codon:yes gene_type:complete